MPQRIDIDLWPIGATHISAEPHDAITVARSLKDSKLYCKVHDNKKSIDLLTRRVGASFSKDKLEIRIFMDVRMILNEREVHPDQDPLNLLRRALHIMEKNCGLRHRVAEVDIEQSDIIHSRDGLYAHATLFCEPVRPTPKILHYVLIAELMWCIDDTLVELDLTDGVYR